MQMAKYLCVAGLVFSTSTLLHAAASIEGYWKNIDDQTGRPVSIVKIFQEPDGTFSGTMVYRYVNAVGFVEKTCSKCPEPYKDKPLIGLKTITHLVQDKKNPDLYTDGKALEVKTGRIFSGKATVISNGRQLKLRGYYGISVLGRNMVWIRTDAPSSDVSNEK